jgi:hypothetical protein
MGFSFRYSAVTPHRARAAWYASKDRHRVTDLLTTQAIMTTQSYGDAGDV